MACAKDVNDVITSAIKSVDPNGAAHLSPSEMKAVFKHLGWSDEKTNKLFDSTGNAANGNSNTFVDFLFKKAAGGTGQHDAPSLGVIRLDYDYPPSPGDIDHPGSNAYDVFYRVVPGLTFQMCQDNAMTEDVKAEFIEAVKFLDEKGVSGITGDCGFMMWFQALAREHTKKPVFMSSLAHLPAITAAFSSKEKIAIFTANSTTLQPMAGLIKDECNIDTQKDRLVIVGCEDVAGFEAVAAGDKVDVVAVLPGMVEKALKLIKDDPSIKVLLLECTELPPYSDALRAATNLPVFDAITNCDFFIRSRMDNPRVGKNDWQKEWDGIQDDYQFGQHLDAGDRAKVVNKAAFMAKEATKKARPAANAGGLEVTTPEYLKAAVPTLGVLRLDYEYTPAPGDVTYPDTFSYPVYYRVVKGLSYQMCKEGKMTPEVQEEFIAAIKYLDDRNVAGITCDCALSFHFQQLARSYTVRPIFLSPLTQLPAMMSAYGKEEDILIVTCSHDDFKPLIPIIVKECDFDPEEERFIVASCDKIPGFLEYIFSKDKHGSEAIEKGIENLVAEHIAKDPLIRCVLFEGTALTPFADAIKASSKLPVFDSLSMCDLFVNGMMDNPLFGLNGWQKKWDGDHEDYTLGQNLGGAEPHKDLLGNVAVHKVGVK